MGFTTIQTLAADEAPGNMPRELFVEMLKWRGEDSAKAWQLSVALRIVEGVATFHATDGVRYIKVEAATKHHDGTYRVDVGGTMHSQTMPSQFGDVEKTKRGGAMCRKGYCIDPTHFAALARVERIVRAAAFADWLVFHPNATNLARVAEKGSIRARVQTRLRFASEWEPCVAEVLGGNISVTCYIATQREVLSNGRAAE